MNYVIPIIVPYSSIDLTKTGTRTMADYRTECLEIYSSAACVKKADLVSRLPQTQNGSIVELWKACIQYT